jgi:hypothetical protein
MAARASFGTYFIHPLVVTAIMVAFTGAALAPEIKFVLVSTVAVPGCFAITDGLTRLPGVSHAL